MECFNSLLLKLQEVHEREVEGWQIKIQELSNKKGCDTKRMEELFTKNQQMKEQQRLLTENIKTLENRLRAGLCDRCKVTQEVAKRRQQEFEASQIQSLQHISLLAAENNNLKTENRRLKDEIRSLRSVLDRGQSDHSSPCSSSEVKFSSSPDLSPSSGPVALISMATSIQAAGGDDSVMMEATHRPDEGKQRGWRERATTRSSSDSFKTLRSPTWKSEQHSIGRVTERRAQSAEGLDQRPSAPPFKDSSSSSSGNLTPSRHVHPSVPCRPKPVKAHHLPIPLSEPSDWLSAVSDLVIPPHLNRLRLPSLVQSNQPGGLRRQVIGTSWHKQSPLKHPPKEPTVLFRLRGLPETIDGPTKFQEKKDPFPRAEGWFADRAREDYDRPLDLSERGKTEPKQNPEGQFLQTPPVAEDSLNRELKTHPLAHGAEPSPVQPLSPSSSSPDNQQEEQLLTRNHKEDNKQNNEPTNEKKVPALTLSLRPVVVLETLNPSLQKQELVKSQSSSPVAEMENFSNRQVKEMDDNEEEDEEEEEEGREQLEEVSRPESNRKRKRTSVELEKDNVLPERKITIKVRSEEKSSIYGEPSQQ